MPERKIKVFYLIERLARAGTELHVTQLIRLLDKSRFEPVLCCLNGAMTDPALLPEGARCHLLDAGWNLMRPRTLGVARTLLRLLREEKPDVLHTFLFVSNILGPLLARRAGVPAVLVTRDRMGIEWQAHFLHHLVQRLANRRTHKILCKTNAMGEEVARIERTAREKIVVLRNGVDLERFDYREDVRAEFRAQLERDHGIPASGTLALAVGNLKPVKGHRFLIEAAAELAPRFPDLRVAIVGDGESRANLQALAAERGLGGRVFLPGSCPDVRPWLRAADLMVAPSLSEGMPNAVLEGMAMALPLALSDIPGHSELAGPLAWYFKPGDAAQLARVLAEALNAPEERARRGRLSLEKARAELSVGAVIRRIEHIYLETLGSPGN